MLNIKFDDGFRSQQRKNYNGPTKTWLPRDRHQNKEKKGSKPRTSGPQEIRNVDTQDVIFHVFLPKQVPDNLQQNLADIEDMMLQHVGQVFDALDKEENGFQQLGGSVKKMIDKWKKYQPKWNSELDEDRFIHFFKQELRVLENGETLPVYIRRQNCTILITKIDEHLLRISTFRPMLPSEIIMSTVGSLSVTFPETSDLVYNKDLLISEIFMRHLHELAVQDFEITLPTSKKGETNYTDYREVADPFLLSDWMVGALVPVADSTNTQQGKISKKIRDEVNCQMSSRAIPFRRSGMWMSIKVALQLQLLEEIGDEGAANMIYKIILLRTLAHICQQYSKLCANIDWDLASQMMAKIGRRVNKLQLIKNSSNKNESIQTLKDGCLAFVENVISEVDHKLTGLWRKAASSHPIVKPINRSMDEFKNDLQHDVFWLDDIITKNSSKNSSVKKAKAKQTKIQNLQKSAVLENSQDVLRSKKIQRYFTVESMLKHKHSFNYFSNVEDVNERLWLYDVESFVKKYGDDNEDLEAVKQISDVIQAYVKIAVPRYTTDNNPIGCSQMILVVLKAIQILDKSTTEKFPLLLDYKSGIHSELFNKLILPHERDMTLLDETLNYFKSRDEVAHEPSLVDKNKINIKSFSVRFACENKEMQEIRKQILKDTELAIAEKNDIVDQRRKECMKLQKELDITKPCSFASDALEHDNKTGTRAFKTITCKRCIIKRDLKWKQNSIAIYECPLPAEDELQFAVVFELRIPKEISVLRDLLTLLNFEMMGQQIFNGGQKRFDENSKSPLITYWTQYLKSRGRSDDYKIGVGSGLGTVHLVSPKIAASGTCYTKIHNPDVLDPNSQFIVENDLGCIYYHEKPLWYPGSKKAEDLCTFQLLSTSCHDMYKNLQRTVGSTTHTQNSVIISGKNVCHRNLTPDEFIQFGSLRAGHRIQVRNLYRCIYDRALSLHHESVLALVFQTLWQVGLKDGDGIRDSHAEFRETDFALGFLEMLEEYVESFKINFTTPLSLLTAIVITVRIMELNEECHNTCYKALRKWREIVDDWVRKIDITIADPLTDTETKNQLKSKLLEITLCSAFSYNINSELLRKVVIQDEDDLVHWFHTITRLSQLTQEQKYHESMSQFGNILLYTANNVVLKLDLQSCPELNKMIQLSLHKFACEKWNKAYECELKGEIWKANADHNHLVVGIYEEDTGTPIKAKHHLHFDFILGTFLVNGFPESTLPAGVMEHPLFRRYFNDCNFKIQRYSERATTVDKFHGKHYDFEVSLKAVQAASGVKFEISNLIIREIQEDNTTLQMLEPSLFRQMVRSTFIDNYTHWLDVDKKLVYFKRLPVKDSDYKLPHDFILSNDGSWKLYDEQHKQYLLSIRSEGFRMISGVLSRLEAKEEINIFMDPKFEQITAKLPRHNLSFRVIENNLHSVEYTDFRVATNQNMGTLIGLQQGLLLELGSNPDKFSKRNLIVPHGFIQTRQIQHQTTTVNLDKLRQPPFFVLEYDTVLRRLKADNSQAAWLYLAALHAATSSSLPDPFTEITGTEYATEILQSGYVWSSRPYDKECYLTLEMVRSFAPGRSYYGHRNSLFVTETEVKASEKMEITRWPEVLPPMAAYDGYAFIVDKLLEDSQRLSVLYPELPYPKRKQDRDVGDSEKLQLRSYLRHLSSYNQAVAVKPNYMKTTTEELIGTGKISDCILRKRNGVVEGFYLRELLKISQTRLLNTFQKSEKSPKCNLVSYLVTMEPLGLPCSSSCFGSLPLKDLLNLQLRGYWLQLYCSSISRNSQQGKHVFSTVLLAMAYKGAPIEQIMSLHHISVLAGSMDFPLVSVFLKPNPILEQEDLDFINPAFSTFNDEEIQGCLENHVKPLDTDISGEGNADLLLKSEAFDEKVKVDAAIITSKLRALWPCEKIVDMKELFKGTSIKYESAMPEINIKIAFWYRNLQFVLFVQLVEDKLNSAYNSFSNEMQEAQKLYSSYQFSLLPELTTKIHITPDALNPIHLESFLQNLPENNLVEAAEIFKSGKLTKIEDSNKKSLEEQRTFCCSKIASLYQDISNCLTSTRERQILFKAGIIPRTIARMLLYHLQNSESNQLVSYVGAMAVLWSHLKRFNRCISLKARGASADQELRRELENSGYDNWSPADHPEWLLLELELDLMIRPVQTNVTGQMMHMPDGNNGVMQLNMGEGKTSVIVPMLCATLGTEDSLCRVTVLNSIFKTNLNILIFALGGLLNKRVYTFPCRRDLAKLDVSCAEKILETYKECLREKGVVLTLPEYRLSFRMLAYDKILKDNFTLGISLIEIENWLRYYCRDILDESDEIFNVKSQLVYTTGEKISIDGDDLRWKTCQKILQSLQNIASNLQKKFGSGVIEFDEQRREKYPEQFTMLRILKDDCVQEFLDSLADEILKELKFSATQKNMVKQFITNEELPLKNHELLCALFQNNPEKLNKILLMSAYLRRGVLRLALTKRWRVDYGVNFKGPISMAVPFKAKDVAVERTEFGHPDLAIVLTHLSYYYYGLSDSELQECLLIIQHKREGEAIYNDWIQQIPAARRSTLLLNFEGLKLHNYDFTERSRLYELLRKHKAVVDFWLSHTVFPREAKQFSEKMVMTPWDLCNKRNRLPLSGFSGTNDSWMLLPLQVSQQDLPELQNTNLEREKDLLHTDNKNHIGLRTGVSCEEILQQMKKDSLKILIDAGALMLECQNEKVAELWLSTDDRLEAVVYFNKENEMVVKCKADYETSRGKRKTNDVLLELSPYRHNLEKCGVFLDDQHTRGTDIKFPEGSKACVTVGSRMKYDKLSQSCLRMRKVGKGHTVTFYLSQEAYDKVLDMKGSTENGVEVSNDVKKRNIASLDTIDIINWVKENTQHYNEDGLLYWALAGKNYMQKLAAEDNFYFPMESVPINSPERALSVPTSKLKVLAYQCVDKEVTTLVDMYGMHTKREQLTDLIQRWFEMTKDKLCSKTETMSLPSRILANIDEMCNLVIERCMDMAPNKTLISSIMEEEQERELEMEKEKETEIEEERQTERPTLPKEVTPSLHDNVKQLVVEGGEIVLKPGIVELCEIFLKTSFWRIMQSEGWNAGIYASEDFCSVISPSGVRSHTDSYLRPVEYLATNQLPNGKFQILVLSPFEVNELLPRFRKGIAAMQLHMFLRRKYQGHDTLLNISCLQLPRLSYRPAVVVPMDCREVAALNLASGTLYFKTVPEKEAFERFLRLTSQPILVEEDSVEVAEEDDKHNDEATYFKDDPTLMARKILSCRHFVQNDSSHVVRILDDSKMLPSNN